MKKMSELKVKDKDVVVPGEVLAEGMDFLPSYGTYREGDKIISQMLGLINIEGKVIKMVPLSGRYCPKKGDTIICEVTEILLAGWRLSTNSAYEAMLSLKDGSSDYIDRGADLKPYFDVGEWVVAGVTNVTSQKLIDLTTQGPGLRKVSGGRIIKVNPHKIPRIIGKQGSMISMVKFATDSKIIVGQNGVIWIDAEDPKNELLAVESIKMIEEKSHISGLTDKMKGFLEKKSGKKIDLEELRKTEQKEEASSGSFGRSDRGGYGGGQRQGGYGGQRGGGNRGNFRQGNRGGYGQRGGGGNRGNFRGPPRNSNFRSRNNQGNR